MYTVDLYLRVRLACHVDGRSQREAASRFGIARETVRKMLRHSEPPGYRRRQPPKRPKLAPFTDIIDRILEEDRPVHRKQHHTAKRIFERLRDEHGFTGKETIVKDYVRERRLRRREMFVPLSHPPGHAQADFGEADAIIAGVKCQWRSKKGPPRRCKKGPLGGCGLVPVVHGRAPRATRRALNRLTRRRAREGPVGPRGQAWAGWSVQLAVGV